MFEILLGVSEGLAWKDAFLKVVPQRKLAMSNAECDDKSIKLEVIEGEDNHNDNSIDSRNSDSGTCGEEGETLISELLPSVKKEEGEIGYTAIQ